MTGGWPVARLGEVIRHRKEFITIDDLAVYRRPRVQLHARGVVLRDEVAGAVIRTKSQQVCRANEFLVAEIDAKVGGYGLVPSDLDGAIVSSHYFLFTIEVEKLDPRFLDYFVRTRRFADQVEAQGSTNYAAIRPAHVLNYQVPLPPLVEQRRIVAALNTLSERVHLARALSEETSRASTALLAAARRELIGASPEPDWMPLSEFVSDIENGKSPATEGRPAEDGEWAVLKVGAVSFGEFDPAENKALPRSFEPIQRFEVKAGDFLMSRANTSELVGACAFVRATPARLMLSDKIFRFTFRDSPKVDLEYLDHVLKSSALRRQIVDAASGTSPTMKNISKAKVLRLRIPRHLPPRQLQIAEKLREIDGRLRLASQLRSVGDIERLALMPAILDRAFKGEM